MLKQILMLMCLVMIENVAESSVRVGTGFEASAVRWSRNNSSTPSDQPTIYKKFNALNQIIMQSNSIDNVLQTSHVTLYIDQSNGNDVSKFQLYFAAYILYSLHHPGISINEIKDKINSRYTAFDGGKKESFAELFVRKGSSEEFALREDFQRKFNDDLIRYNSYFFNWNQANRAIVCLYNQPECRNPKETLKAVFKDPLTKGKVDDNFKKLHVVNDEFVDLFIFMNNPDFDTIMLGEDMQELLRSLLRPHTAQAERMSASRLASPSPDRSSDEFNTPSGSLRSTPNKGYGSESGGSVASHWTSSHENHIYESVAFSGDIPHATGAVTFGTEKLIFQDSTHVPEIAYLASRNNPNDQIIISPTPVSIDDLSGSIGSLERIKSIWAERKESDPAKVEDDRNQKKVVEFIFKHLIFIRDFLIFTESLKENNYSQIKPLNDFFVSKIEHDREKDLKALYDAEMKGKIKEYKGIQESFKDQQTTFATLYKRYGDYLKEQRRESFLEGINLSVLQNSLLILEELRQFEMLSNYPSKILQHKVVRNTGDRRSSLSYMENIARFFMGKIAHEMTQPESVQNSLTEIINMMRDLEIRGTLDTRGRNNRTLILETNSGASTSPIQMARVDRVIAWIEANAANVITIIKNP